MARTTVQDPMADGELVYTIDHRAGHITNESWSQVEDAKQRKRMQNRIAQRTYREKLKKRIEALEQGRDVAVAPSLKQCHSESGTSGLDTDRKLSGRKAQCLDMAEKLAAKAGKSYVPVQQPPVVVPPTSSRQSSLSLFETRSPPTNARQVTLGRGSQAERLEIPWTPSSDSGLSMKDFAEDTNCAESDEYSSGMAWEAVGEIQMDDNGNVLDFQHNESVFSTSLLESTSDEPLKLLQPLSVSSPSPHNGKTALHLAAERGKHASVRLLLDHTPDIYAQDTLGRTALHLAVENKHDTVAQALLVGRESPTMNGVDIQDHKGQTALHIAVRTGQGSTVDSLLRAKADLEVRDRSGRTALHLAVLMEEDDIVQILLDNRADAGARVG